MLDFSKMHGAGNDFVVIDQGKNPYVFTAEMIRKICDRKRGVGADGLILLSPLGKSRVRMDFYNCDGSSAGMCGNGLRCAAAFARKYGLADSDTIEFQTGSGLLHAWVLGPELVKIELQADTPFRKLDNVCGYTVYAGVVGVPHAVIVMPPETNAEEFKVFEAGRIIRYAKEFAPSGTNVDFLWLSADRNDPVIIRTYERGVEDETLACGTGIGSSAVVLHQFFGFSEKVSFLSRSKDVLKVEISQDGYILKEINLTGPAVEAFRGTAGAFDFD